MLGIASLAGCAMQGSDCSDLAAGDVSGSCASAAHQYSKDKLAPFRVNKEFRGCDAMSEWDFLYDMRERGYSAQEIADAAGSGAAPWEWEYLSREWVNSQLQGEPEDDASLLEPGTSFRGNDGTPFSTLKQVEIFHDLVDCAERHFENTGRYLQIWGELGEIYAEIKFGLIRHKAHTAGSDGTISGKLIEVKTISPEKSSDRVLVKSQGNFEQLLIVRIDRDFQFTGKLFDRDQLNGLSGKYLSKRLRS